MMDPGQLAMHGFTCSHNSGTIDLSDGLVTQTDAEDGKTTIGELDEFHADSCLVWSARTRRENYGLGVQRKRFRRGQIVVSAYDNFSAQLSEIVEQVVGKAVVVIDQKQQNAPISQTASSNRSTKDPIYDGKAASWKRSLCKAAPSFFRKPLRKLGVG